MRKIRCPRCAVINMEGFTTFPYCAACGTRLPDSHDERTHVAWARPLRSTLWAAIIGCAVLGLALYATNFFEAAPNSDTSSLKIRGSAPRTARVGEQTLVSIFLSGASGVRAGRNLNYEDMKLRLPRDLFKNFELRSLEPAPDNVEKRGNGHYYHYSSLPHDSLIQVTLLPLKAGVFRISAEIFGGNELQNNKDHKFEESITVIERLSQPSVPSAGTKTKQ
jgi:hypothetical protein